MSADSALLEKIGRFPHSPGVYLMKSARGDVLYVGKSTDLRSRVRQYFAGQDTRPRIHSLMKQVSDVDCIVTASEKEALLLENSLIKEHQAPYNVSFRDDKDYLWLKMDMRHDFPRLVFVRRPKHDQSKLFGPFASARAARETVRFVSSMFPLRTCSDFEFANRSRPCLEYQMMRCPAPCVGNISREDYGNRAREAMLFLSGKRSEVVRELEAEMAALSAEERFEEAAAVRDRIDAIRKTLEPQSVNRAESQDQDVLGMAREADRLTVILMAIRQGKLTDTKTYHRHDVMEDDPEVLAAFLLQHYEKNAVPSQILLPFSVAGMEEMQGELKSKALHAVSLEVPERGMRKSLTELARKNAENALQIARREEERNHDLLAGLQKELSLRNFPAVMDCLDISNISGEHAVGSAVVFRDGIASKKDYRKFRVRLRTSDGTTLVDDYAMMREVVRRRYARLLRESKPLPDLIVIDGGRGHVEAARTVLAELNAETDLIGLAKDKESGVQPRVDRVYKAGAVAPIILSSNAAAAFVLMRLRDEAHRFAITYHRVLRSKNTIAGELEKIPGIGPKTLRKIMRAFGSPDAVKKATVEDLVGRGKLHAALADRLYRHFHPETPA
ncbi:MAG: excinuclease ABC subunit UvrC [Nitrospirae bacterium]|nr:excinuclease ABC subunit UvrC [Nitrospirota bacterium]